MGEALAATPLARWNVMEQAKGTTAQQNSVTSIGLKLRRGHVRSNNVYIPGSLPRRSVAWSFRSEPGAHPDQILGWGLFAVYRCGCCVRP
jgi:hypothetical protein